jgi:hypothetical protein
MASGRPGLGCSDVVFGRIPKKMGRLRQMLLGEVV